MQHVTPKSALCCMNATCKLIVALSLLTSNPAFCRHLADSTLTQQKLLEDFDTFQQIYQTANSGLYKYHKKTSIDSAFKVNRAALGPHSTTVDLYRLTYAVTDYSGSLHSDNYLPTNVDSLLKTEAHFFPYPVKVIDNQLLINTTQAPIPLGSRLVAVNGTAVGVLLNELGKYATTDGYNKTGKAYLISKHFALYYRLQYGPHNSYTITYTTPDQRDTLQATLPAVTYSVYSSAYKQRHSLPLEQALPKYSFAVIDSLSAARLTIRTFALGGPKRASHQRYARFLDSTFQFLATHPQIRHLIVDVRHNGGGNDPNDLLLYSYLTQRRFRENKRAFTIFRQVPFPTYFIEDTPGDRQELEQELQAEHHPKAHGGKYYLRKTERPYWKPSSNAFRGNIYLLIDPQVASAGSLFASLVRSDQRAVVIGEETSGGYYGHTGHTPVEYQLPNTGIRVKFSIIDLEQDVRRSVRFPKGQGVIPDYVVGENITSFLGNQDRVMSYTLRLIGQQNPEAGGLPAQTNHR